MKKVIAFINTNSTVLFIFLLIILVSNFLFHVISNVNLYTKPYDAKYWEYRYFRSQWFVDPPIEPIGDDGLYAYSGWEYIHGRDPSTLNAEIPPLGKYLIGLTIITFHNQNIFGIISSLLLLVLLFIFNKNIFKNNILAILLIVLFSFEPLFFNQLKAPYLDSIFTCALLIFLIGMIRNNFIIAQIGIGLMMGIKSPTSSFVLLITTSLVFLYIKKSKDIRKFLYMIPISLVVFVLIYSRYFLGGHSLKDFLGLQKYIYVFYAIGAKGRLLTVWEMLISGRWVTWWGPILRVEEWNIVWTVLLLASIASIALLVLKRVYKSAIILCAIWVVVYLLFLNVIPVWPRYLLLLIPFMYNLLIWLIFSKNTKLK